MSGNKMALDALTAIVEADDAQCLEQSHIEQARAAIAALQAEEVERLAAQAAPSEPQIDSRFPAAHYGHDLQPSQAPVVQAVQTEVRFKYESMKPIDGYDAIYAEYATTFGRYPDDFMSKVVRQTKEDLFMWWGAHREKIRAGLVLLAAQEDASSGATTQAVRMLTAGEIEEVREDLWRNTQVDLSYLHACDAAKAFQRKLAEVNAGRTIPPNGEIGGAA